MESIKDILTKRYAAILPDFHRRRVIFWHDPDREFAENISEYVPDGVKLLKITGNNWFYAKKLLYADDTESDYLVYLPLQIGEKSEENYLGDMERYSETFRADMISMRLEELGIPEDVSMRRAMKRYRKFFDSKERMAKVKAFGTTYTSAGQLHIDVLAAICGTVENTLTGIVKALLTQPLCYDKDEIAGSMQRFQAEDVLFELLARKLGYSEFSFEEPLKFAAYLLLSRLSLTVDRKLLFNFSNLIPDEKWAQACGDIVTAWMNSKDSNELFEIARMVEAAYAVPKRLGELDIEALSHAECFPCIHECIIRKFMTDIAEDRMKYDAILQTVEKRRMMQWYDRFSCYYEGLLQIAEMKKFVQEHMEKYHYANNKEMFQAYCKELHRMDTYYRYFYATYRKCIGTSDSDLEDLFQTVADYAERLYKTEYLAVLNTAWTELTREDFALTGYLPDVPLQSRFYRYTVAPLAENSRVFVIISDALRFEVAAELCEKLIRETKGTAELTGMQSVFPSVTKCGMAALLPHRKLRLTEDGKVLCDEQPTDGTANREKLLQMAYAKNVALTTEELFSMKKKERHERIQNAKVVYLYHNVIDAVGDKRITENQVFDACGDAIEELKNIVRIIINDMNGSRIFITADHGFLYTAQPLEESEKVGTDLVSGELLEQDHRYCIADANSHSTYLLPVSLRRFQSQNIGYAAPSCIRIRKQGGGVNYVHGGISLQELTVPVIAFRNLRAGSKKYVEAKKVTLQLLTATHRVSNTIVNMNLFQKEAVGGKILPNEFEAYFSDENGNLISDVQLVIADSTASNPPDRVFRKRFSMKSMQYSGEVRYFFNIVEKDSGNCIERTEFTIHIAFTDDFDF